MSDESSDQTSNAKNLIVEIGHRCEFGDLFTINSYSTDGDILSINVQYSGGCEDHDFDLYFNGALKKSLPPQATLCLTHNSNGDICKALIQDTLEFNISELKQNNDSVIININDNKEQIEYK